MNFSTLDDLKPVYSGDQTAQRRFVAMFKHLVAIAASRIGTHSPAVERKDIEEELWIQITDNNWEMVRKYAGKGSFEGYLKRCIAFRAVDLGRQYTRQSRAHISWEQEAIHDTKPSLSEDSFESILANDIVTTRNGHDISFATIDSYHDALLNIMREAITQLPSEDRLLIKMVVYDRAPATQIAEILNLECKGTCYTRKNRIIARLKSTCTEQLAALMTTAAYA